VTPNRTRVRIAAQERRAATEQAILRATEALLEVRSFRDISVEQVMSAAGLSRTAFYRYFPDLESVVTRLMGTLVDELGEASRQWLFSEHPQTQLRDSLLHFAAVYRDHGRLMQAFYDAAGGGPDLRQQWGGTLGELVEPVERYIELLGRSGRVEVAHPTETVRALSVLTDRYLLDVYWSDDQVPIERPAAVLEQIWARTLRLR
jgi:TetR/AcrR family transcriptional regulator, ethionamide resistance regulator